MAAEDITVHGKITPHGSQEVATMEQARRRRTSCISSLRAARRRHASVRMDIDTQTIFVISVPFQTTPGPGYRRTGKVVAEFGTCPVIRDSFWNDSVILE
jgi:hypothetical protein